MLREWRRRLWGTNHLSHFLCEKRTSTTADYFFSYSVALGYYPCDFFQGTFSGDNTVWKSTNKMNKEQNKSCSYEIPAKPEGLHLLPPLNIELVRHQSPSHIQWGIFLQTWYFCAFFFLFSMKSFLHFLIILKTEKVNKKRTSQGTKFTQHHDKAVRRQRFTS